MAQADGFVAIELAQRCGPHSTVFAADRWKPVVERLRRKIAYLGIRNLHVLEQDAADLDIPESSIDVITSNLGINNFENVDAVLQKCFRLLKPDGLLLLTTNLVGHMRELYDVYRQTLIEVDLTDRLSFLEAHIAHRATIESLRAQLEGAGFQVVAVTERSFQMRFADGSSLLRHYFTRLGFLEGWMNVVPPELVEKTFLTLERNLNSVAAERVELALSIPMACIEGRRPRL